MLRIKTLQLQASEVMLLAVTIVLSLSLTLVSFSHEAVAIMIENLKEEASTDQRVRW